MQNQTDIYKKIIKKHTTFLQKFQTFPDKTRKVIYKELLQLPLNHKHFKQLSKPYPILPEHGLNKQVAFITWVLSTLYPQLKIQCIPGMVHPFVKLFQEDSIFAFECSLSFLLNWLHPIISDYPNPSSQIMDIFSDYLPNLQKKVNEFDYPISSIIHPMFLVTLTDVINKQDWLQLFDYLVTHPFKPWHLICFCLALVKCVENTLVKLPSIQSIALCLRKQKNINMKYLISEIENVEKIYLHRLTNIYKNSFFPISTGRYPIYRFIKEKMRLQNDKLNHKEQEELRDLQKRFQKLEKLIEHNSKTGLIADQKQIAHKYQAVQGQMKVYLQKVKKQHSNKIEALRQIQNNFKEQLLNQGKQRDPSLPIEAIERRARLQKQILRLTEEANSIQKMQDQMIERINDQVAVRKKELIEDNRRLRQYGF